MLFNSVQFLFFFTIFFVVFKFLARTPRQKLWCLCVGSLLFYGSWDYRFVALLAGTALFDFFIARAIAATSRGRPSMARMLMWSSVGLNLGVLSSFKYWHFFSTSVPIGISFYTFQSMSYVIDVYREESETAESPLQFLSAVSFFPHLLAGPIIRANFLLPQFREFKELEWKYVQRGFSLIAIGLFKKTVADLLGTVADRYFASGGAHDLLESWTGVLSFVGQIYGDFSGYTDIAIGVALLLGIVIPPNFSYPFSASSPLDYWRRWHISLSTWIRDYVFQPLALAMARRFSSGPYVALAIAMLAAGVWHGGSWNFALFGLYWGLLLVSTQALSVRFPGISEAPPASVTHSLKVVVTFYLASLALGIFRAQSLSQAWKVIGEMHGLHAPTDLDSQRLATLALVLVGLGACHFVNRLDIFETDEGAHPLLWPALASLFAFAFTFGGSSNAFIYFQF